MYIKLIIIQTVETDSNHLIAQVSLTTQFAAMIKTAIIIKAVLRQTITILAPGIILISSLSIVHLILFEIENLLIHCSTKCKKPVCFKGLNNHLSTRSSHKLRGKFVKSNLTEDSASIVENLGIS